MASSLVLEKFATKSNCLSFTILTEEPRFKRVRVITFFFNSLWLRGIMIGPHFHENMKVQTATSKDNNNSKSRAATYVKFEINIK